MLDPVPVIRAWHGGQSLLERRCGQMDRPFIVGVNRHLVTGSVAGQDLAGERLLIRQPTPL